MILAVIREPCLPYILHTHTAHFTHHTTGTDLVRIPNNQIPIDAAGAHFADASTLELVRSHARDGVLVHRQQLRVRRRTSSHVPAAVGVTEGGERNGVEASHARARVGTLARRAVVEAPDALPSALGAGKDYRLAVVPSSHDGVLGGPCQRDKRKRRDANVVNSRAAWVDDADRAIMACTEFMRLERDKEKRTYWQTQERPRRARSQQRGPNRRRGWRTRRKWC